MRMQPGKSVGGVAAWSFLAVVSIVAAACAAWSGASKENWQDAPPAIVPDKGVGAWNKEVSERTVSLITDGNVLVDFRTKPNDPMISRFVSRLISRRFTPADPNAKPPAPAKKTTYNILVTANRANRGGEVKYTRATRLDPDPNPDKNPFEDSSEMTVAVPDEGVVVINGMAPIVVCKKATIASAGTTFAIESVVASDPSESYWQLSVIDADAQHPVQIYFEGSRVLKTVNKGECIRYKHNATAIAQNIAIPQGDCEALTSYVNALLNAVNP